MLHTTSNRLAILKKINVRLSALMQFTIANPSTSANPWTTVQSTEHRRLQERWREAVQELEAFEHPGAS